MRTGAEHGHDLLITDLLVGASLVPLAELGSVCPAILVVSAHPDRQSLAETVGVEAISKPYDVEELVHVVKRLVSQPLPEGLRPS